MNEEELSSNVIKTTQIAIPILWFQLVVVVESQPLFIFSTYHCNALRSAAST